MVLRRSKFPKTSLSVGLAPLRRKLETTRFNGRRVEENGDSDKEFS